MLWTEKDSKNLERIANALETLSGKKTFIPTNDKVEIEVVEDNEEQDKKVEEERNEKVSKILNENEGKHLWEETNLEDSPLDKEEF